MATQARPYTHYVYEGAKSNHSHGYLAPAIRASLRDLPRGSKILDLGCGNGSLTASWPRPGDEVTGVDLSESGIEAAQRAYRSIQFVMGDVTADLKVLGSRQPFDAVVSAEVIEHVYAPRALVANAFRLLRPGGRFIVTTPYHGYWKNVVLAVTGQMDAHFTVLWDGGHIKFWSRRTLSHVVREAGFDDISFDGAGRIPYLWKSMVLRATRP